MDDREVDFLMNFIEQPRPRRRLKCPTCGSYELRMTSANFWFGGLEALSNMIHPEGLPAPEVKLQVGMNKDLPCIFCELACPEGHLLHFSIDEDSRGGATLSLMHITKDERGKEILEENILPDAAIAEIIND